MIQYDLQGNCYELGIRGDKEMSKWKCEICNEGFDNFHAQGFDGKIYCPLCFFKEKTKRLQQELQRKDNNWNELKKWLNEPHITYNFDASDFGIEKIECVSVKDTLNKIQELENENNNKNIR